MVALGDLCQRLHLTLNIDHHGVNRPGDNGQLLLEKVACHGDAMAHEDLVGGTAHPGDIDSLRPGGLGCFLNLWVLDHVHNDLWEQRFVSVDHEIDLIFFNTPRLIFPRTGTGVPKRIS